MAMSFTLTYSQTIEEIKDEPDFEERGDALFLEHPDDEARLEWAFYRPSGSHPKQVADSNAMVSIMAFNHSRLGALERFTLLHNEVLDSLQLRNKIRNRSRMLFRALIDDDFSELNQVLDIAPQFLELACNQMINGRIWNESYADLNEASTFIKRVESILNEALFEGIARRLPPIVDDDYETNKALLNALITQKEQLHPKITIHYHTAFLAWVDTLSIHTLQRIALKREIEKLKP